MAVTKEQKKEILGRLREEIRKAKIVIMVNFHGLNVALATELRRILKSSETSYMVAKKTLVRKALEEFGVKGDAPSLEGEIALAFSSGSPEVPAKALRDFAKAHKNVINLAGGIFENNYINGSTVVILANIPPREILLSQLVQTLNTPIRGLVVTLGGTMRNLVSVLSQVKH